MSQAAAVVLLLSLIGVSNVSLGQSGASELLKLETTIPMANVQGRIDGSGANIQLTAMIGGYVRHCLFCSQDCLPEGRRSLVFEP